MIDELQQPTGYNIGLNLGKNSGASIDHLHYHLVPRYNSELGFIDIIGKSRVVVEKLSDIFEKFRKNIDRFF